ncbi:MAG: hypothetical protein GY730_11715 [bacterium]|nr:hypothetical protein [bacterium]
MSIIEQLAGRESGFIIQFIKYGIAGGIATLSHIVLFHLISWRALPALQQNDLFVRIFNISVTDIADAVRSRNSMINNFIVFVFSNFIAYSINIYWVFTPGKYIWFIEIALFYMVSGVSVFTGTLLMGYLIKRYGLRTTYAFTANLVVAVLINYAMRKLVIFKY